MAYYDQLELLKNALNSYSAEQEKFSELYKAAKENAVTNNAEAKRLLEEQYYHDKNEAYADNARDERNLNTTLADRGLGFSGETAQAKLYSNITLNNRLGDLTRQKNETASKYDMETRNTIQNLTMDEATKSSELIQQKNQLNADIADMELRKETADADREAERILLADRIAGDLAIQDERLQAERKQLLAQIQADKDLQTEKLQSDKNLQDDKLRASMQELLAQIQAEKELQSEKLQSDKNLQDDKLQASMQELLAQIQADKDLQSEKIQSDKDLQNAKLQASMQELLVQIQADKDLQDSKFQASMQELLTQIQADKDLQNSKIEAEMEKLLTQIKADKNLQEDKIKAEMEKLLKEIQAEKDIANAKIQAEKAQNDANIKADKELLQLRIEADKELQELKNQAEKDTTNAKLQAEIEKLEAELKAKYSNNNSGSANSSSGSNSSNKNSGSSTNQSTSSAYVPSITAKELASKLMSTTGSKSISSERDEYIINKYMLELLDNYDMDSTYYTDLVFVLKAYGYEELTEPELRVQVLSYEAKSYANSAYNDIYDSYILKGYNESTAKSKTKEDILNNQMQTFYNKTNNLTEFRMCCNYIGISTTDTQSFINKKMSAANNTSGSSGSSIIRVPTRESR